MKRILIFTLFTILLAYECPTSCPKDLLGNGTFDVACNLPECGSDGGDCQLTQDCSMGFK